MHGRHHSRQLSHTSYSGLTGLRDLRRPKRQVVRVGVVSYVKRRRNGSDRPWPVLEAVALVLALLVGWRLMELRPMLVARAGTAGLCRTHCQAKLGQLQQAQLHREPARPGTQGAGAQEAGPAFAHPIQ